MGSGKSGGLNTQEDVLNRLTSTPQKRIQSYRKPTEVKREDRVSRDRVRGRCRETEREQDTQPKSLVCQRKYTKIHSGESHRHSKRGGQPQRGGDRQWDKERRGERNTVASGR